MRYHNTFIAAPNISGRIFMSGPQNESEIDAHIRALLDLPGITAVLVEFNHGAGPRGEYVRKMPLEGTGDGRGDENATGDLGSGNEAMVAEGPKQADPAG